MPYFKQVEQRIPKVNQIAWPYLSDFWSKRSNVVLAEFGSGTTFDANEQPIGTIIREHREKISFVNQSHPYYFEIALLGVVCEVKLEQALQRYIAYYSPTSEWQLAWIGIRDPQIQVGVIDHEKVASALFSERRNDLNRVNKIEILKVGLAQAQRSPSRGSLLPSFSFGHKGTARNPINP